MATRTRANVTTARRVATGLAAAAAAVLAALTAAASGPRPFVPNDPDYPLNAAAARDLALPDAWALTRGSRSIVVAVVDTGLVADADLEVASSWCVAPGCTSAADENGHGTVMAHIAAGHVDNGLDGAGVCGRCRVMVVKVTDARGRFGSDELAAGIRGAVEHGARVINLSLGSDPGAPPAPAVNAAAANAIASGIPVVMAAGNAGLGSPSANAMASSSPAAIRVANVAPGTKKLARNSNRGRWVDVAAPGTETSAVGAATRSTDAGTSDSAAYTSGVVALMLSCNPRLTPAALKAALLRTGTPVDGLDVASGKVVNAYAAVRAAGCR